MAKKIADYTPPTKLRGVYWIHPVRPSVHPSVRRRCPDDNLNSFDRIFFQYMYHLGEDLGWEWIWASYLIKYAYNGCSCDLGIFGIPEVNFYLEPSNMIFEETL